MKPDDKELGMGQRITRRDFLEGFGGLAAASLAPGQLLAATGKPGSYYPPAATGMRGSHAGSFEVAHELARFGRTDWGPGREPDKGIYDLVVVGGGISGLSAAYYYRQKNADARILILDNHDDFGGHATRNEFQVGGRTLIGYGGAQSFESPSGYNDLVKKLFSDIGIVPDRYIQAYDQNLYKKFGLSNGTYFQKEHWGSDRLIPYGIGMHDGYRIMADSPLSAEEAVARFPISVPARDEFLRLLQANEDALPHLSLEQKWEYLDSISYREFLARHAGITEEEVFAVLQDLCADSCVGIEAAQATTALGYNRLPGWELTGLEKWTEEPYIHHFPDGNAGMARLLVRSLIPQAAQGSSMDDVVLASFDYSHLDKASSRVRLRLNSTAVRVQHEGGPGATKGVRIDYVHQGEKNEVRARNCVLACYNAIIPALCPELPRQQKEALALAVKAPILYTNVALRNWQAWNKLGVAAVVAPSGYHSVVMLDFPVSMGGHEFAKTPDDPIVVHMERFVHTNNQGLTAREQHRLGRQELLTTPFEEIERQIRTQLAGMLGEGGFDPTKDIEAITVNRWSHGYANRGNPLFVPYYKDSNDLRWPHVQGRQPFGRITIANSDAAGRAVMPAAVAQAYRAVNELG
jgi:spermidine dehydrogenase